MQVFEGTSNIDNKHLELNLNPKLHLLDSAMNHHLYIDSTSHLVHGINYIGCACYLWPVPSRDEPAVTAGIATSSSLATP